MAIGGLRLWLSTCALLLAAATMTPALALSLEVNGCENQDSKPGLRIDFCTQVIESGQYAGSKLAWAYVSRGWAYTENGELDKGIKDFDEALRLKPNYGLPWLIGGWPMLARRTSSAPSRISMPR